MTIDNPGQREVAERVKKTLLSHDDREVGAVEVVLGRRGSGKTTTLEKICSLIKQERELWIMTPMIQAPDVQPGENLMVPVLGAIHRAILDDHKRRKQGGAKTERWSEHVERSSEHVEKVAKDIIGQALSRSESFRELAKDLAMSPEHYGHMMLTHHEQHQRIKDHFEGYLDRALEHHQQLVVFVDDIDLVSDPATVQAFFGDLHTLYRVKRVHWVLSFDLQRIIECLSPTRPSATCSSTAPLRDMAVGRSIVEKLAPMLLSRHLRPWKVSERLLFRPPVMDRSKSESGNKSGSDAPTLGELLRRHEIDSPEFVLPDDPRPLLMLHSWLTEQPVDDGKGSPAVDATAEAEKEAGEAKKKAVEAKSLDFLRACASARGLPRVAEILEEDELDFFFRTLDWPTNSSHVHWRRLTAAIIEQEALPPLPVPAHFTGLDADDLSDLLEAILDHGLYYDYIEPLELLTRLPTTASLLDHIRLQRDYDGHELVRHFEMPGDVQRRALDLQTWADTPQNGLWKLEITPKRLWRDAHLVGRFGPLSMLDQLALRPVHPLGHGEKHGSLLPRRLRALLLFVCDLAAMPWMALSQVTRLWSPLSMSRIAAGFLLTALSQHLVVDAKVPEWLVDWRHASNTIETLLAWDDTDIEEKYSALFEGLERLHDTIKQDLRPLTQPKVKRKGVLTNEMTIKELVLVLGSHLHCTSLAGLVARQRVPGGHEHGKP